MNVRLGRISCLVSPGYGNCLRCKTSWLFVKKHLTRYVTGEGCFALCQKCWAQLTPEQRLPYYRELVTMWNRDKGDMFYQTWREIKTAVLAGK